MKFMNKKEKIRLLTICSFFLIGQILQADFKKNFMHEPFNLSIKSSQFLKNILILQKNFFQQRLICDEELLPCVQSIESMIALNESIYKNLEMSYESIHNLFELADSSKKILVTKKTLSYCPQKDLAWQRWWNYLEESFKSVQLRGYEKDFAWLQDQIVHEKIISSIDLCIELMQHFNGMMVTDYDLLVLANLVVALVAMQC